MPPSTTPHVLAFALLLPSSLAAQTSGRSNAPPALKTVQTLTVSTEPVPLESLDGSVTSLTLDTQDAANASTASEVLRFLPSAHYSQNGAKGSLGSVSIRGGKPNFTLVLIDGIAANDIGDQLGGAFNFNSIDVDDIERIDIFRGPLSALYGSEAISGVVNIALRSPYEQPHLHLSTEAGQYGYTRAAARLSHLLHTVAVSANGSFSRIGQQVYADDSLLGTASLAAEKQLGPSNALHAFARWNRLSDSTLPISSGGPLFALSRIPEINLSNQIAGGTQLHTQITPRWLSNARGAVFSRVASDNTPAILDRIPPGRAYVPSSISHTRFLRTDLMTTQQVNPRPWLESYSSFTLRKEAGTTIGSLAGYLPASYQLSRFTANFSEDAGLHGRRGSLTGGLSLETTGRFGTIASPRAGGSLMLGAYRLHASWGEGFKLPSFYSLGNPLVGNAALLPETSSGADVGLARDFTRTHAHVALSYFDNRYRNLIDFSPALFKLVNRSQAFSRGFDLEASQKIRRLSLGAAVTYLDAGLVATADRLRDVPRWSEEAHGRLELPLHWTVQLQTAWVGRRFDYQVPVPQLSTVSRYSTTNLQVSHHFSDFVSGFLRMENAFNNKYMEFVGFPSPGIYASVGVSYSSANKHP